MELVDIVTEQNEVIGQIDKDEAHKTGVLHRCVIAEVIDSQGKWILVKQAHNRQDGDRYVSPVGGHVQSGESDEEAVIRETLEEMGIQTTNPKLVGRAIFNRDVIGRKENHFCALYEVHTDDLPTLNHESVEYVKLTPEEIKNELRSNPTKFGDAFFFAIQNFYPSFL